MEKSWFTVLLISMVISIQAAAETYRVQVDSRIGPRVYEVSAPTDAMALDSVYIAVIYSGFHAQPFTATVLETGLSTKDIPYRTFRIQTARKYYELAVHTVNIKYAMTVIEATRALLSTSPTKEIRSGFQVLSYLPIYEYVLKFESGNKKISLHTDNYEEGLIALDFAARVSKKHKEYMGIEARRLSCVGMFAN
jgi:hypothetical protein